MSLTAPSVLTLLDRDGDTVVVLSLNDEESDTEEKDTKSQVELEFIEFVFQNVEEIIVLETIELYYWSKTFDELHLDSLSPPPRTV